jgi:hypothetical protein
VNLVLGTSELTTIGGVGTYLVTIAERLERMGHGVAILAPETGRMAAIAAERGLGVVTGADELPESCDAVYAQDAPSAYALAGRYRGVPQAFCVHVTRLPRGPSPTGTSGPRMPPSASPIPAWRSSWSTARRGRTAV